MIQEEYTECVICQKPLGSDSRDLRYRTCPDHRTCIKCELPLSPAHIALCHKRVLEDEESIDKMILIHPRCQVLERSLEAPLSDTESSTADPTLTIKQSEYNFLNLLRLGYTPNLELADSTNEENARLSEIRLIASMNFEQKLVHLKMIESCVAACSIALRTTKEYRKEAFKEREVRQQKIAEKQARTSSRPVGKSEDDPIEETLGTFMELHGLTERKTAMKIMKDTWRAIEGLVKIGIPEPMARQNVTAGLVKKGILKK